MNGRIAKLTFRVLHGTFVIPIFVLTSISAAPSPQSQNSTQSQQEPTVLFALWPAEKGKRPPGPIIDTIATLDKSNTDLGLVYQSPAALSDQEPSKVSSYKTFVNRYFRPGLMYRAYFGGTQIGTITTIESAEFDCNSLAATVKTSLSRSVRYPNMGLVATSESFRQHQNQRRATTPAEIAQLSKLAAQWFGRIGLDQRLLRKIKIEDSVATVIDSRPVLIGSISLLAPAARHHLFLIAEPSAEGIYKMVLPAYHMMQDLVDGTDSEYEQFVDQLDLDGDGVDEIVSMVSFYESREYHIYKRESDGWANVYKGGGGGC